MHKYSIKNLWHLVLLWFALSCTGGPAIGMIIIIYLEYSIGRKMPLYNYVFTGVLVALYLMVLAIWRKSTFRRKDFIKIARNIGVRFTDKNFHFAPIEALGVYTFCRGFLDNIFVVAKMDMPYFTYYPAARVSPWKPVENGKIVVTGGFKPDHMKEESKVELFSLIKGPFDMDIEIKIDGKKRMIPRTDSPEIDKIFSESLAGTLYFHARLIFNKDCLRMAIIGGSWEGRRFGEKILKGFELFNKLNDELKSKYPVMSWKNWQVKWNRKEEHFYLEQKK